MTITHLRLTGWPLEKKPGKYYAVGRSASSGRYGSVNEINVRGGESITVVNERIYSRALNQADRKLGRIIVGQIGRDAKTGIVGSVKGARKS